MPLAYHLVGLGQICSAPPVRPVYAGARAPWFGTAPASPVPRTGFSGCWVLMVEMALTCSKGAHTCREASKAVRASWLWVRAPLPGRSVHGCASSWARAAKTACRFPHSASPLCAGICPVVENHKRRGSMEDKDQDPRKVQRAVIRDGTKDLSIRRMPGSDRLPPASRRHLCPESQGGSPEREKPQRGSG